MSNFLWDSKDQSISVVPGVDDIRSTLQHFRWADYAACFIWLTLTFTMGMYVGIFNIPDTVQEYLMGNRKIKSGIAAMSLISSFTSGVFLLAIPTISYLYAFEFVYIILGIVIMTVIAHYIYLPVLFSAQVSSIYEYLEKRFSKFVRIFAASLYVLDMMVFLPMVIYIAPLYLEQVTQIPATIAACILGICVVYTSVGGFKSMLWISIMQTFMVFVVLILVVTTATFQNENILQRLKTRFFLSKVDLEWVKIQTFLLLALGGSFSFINILGINQNMWQKYASLSSLSSIRIASWLLTTGLCLIIFLCTLCGEIIYEKFHECDPLTTQLAENPTSIVPIFLMQIFEDYPGLLGLFVAGIWGASISCFSSTLNALTTICVEDLCIKRFSENLNLIKLIPLVIGIISISWIHLLKEPEDILKVATTVSFTVSGPILGIFTAGVMLPWINSKGITIGSAVSIILMSWLCFNETFNDDFGQKKAFSTEECQYHYNPNGNDYNKTQHILIFHQYSYIWVTLVGSFVTMCVGLLVNLLTKPSDPRDINAKLLAPFLRHFIKARNFPNQPNDGIIFAYNLKK